MVKLGEIQLISADINILAPHRPRFTVTYCVQSEGDGQGLMYKVT